jgi:hypothetical protein
MPASDLDKGGVVDVSAIFETLTERAAFFLALAVVASLITRWRRF